MALEAVWSTLSCWESLRPRKVLPPVWACASGPREDQGCTWFTLMSPAPLGHHIQIISLSVLVRVPLGKDDSREFSPDSLVSKMSSHPCFQVLFLEPVPGALGFFFCLVYVNMGWFSGVGLKPWNYSSWEVTSSLLLYYHFFLWAFSLWEGSRGTVPRSDADSVECKRSKS